MKSSLVSTLLIASIAFSATSALPAWVRNLIPKLEVSLKSHVDFPLKDDSTLIHSKNRFSNSAPAGQIPYTLYQLELQDQLAKNQAAVKGTEYEPYFRSDLFVYPEMIEPGRQAIDCDTEAMKPEWVSPISTLLGQDSNSLKRSTFELTSDPSSLMTASLTSTRFSLQLLLNFAGKTLGVHTRMDKVTSQGKNCGLCFGM